MQFTQNQKQAARKADLYEYLKKYHAQEVKSEGSSLYLKANHSVYVKRGYSGFIDFSTGEHGNSIDFLVTYLNYTLVDAVLALTQSSPVIAPIRPMPPTPLLPLSFPPACEGQYKQTFAYLRTREIPAETVQDLISRELLYQSREHNNMVFINPEKDFAELRGTYTYGKPYHGVLKSSPDRFWYYKPYEDKTTNVYVCEAAIDAISLYLLRRKIADKGEVYVSIAGVANQQTIDRLKRGCNVILAVDNDKAGDIRREANKELEYILPVNKDWNEDLIKGVNRWRT